MYYARKSTKTVCASEAMSRSVRVIQQWGRCTRWARDEISVLNLCTHVLPQKFAWLRNLPHKLPRANIFAHHATCVQPVRQYIGVLSVNNYCMVWGILAEIDYFSKSCTQKFYKLSNIAVPPSWLFAEVEFGWKICELWPCVYDCSFEIALAWKTKTENSFQTVVALINKCHAEFSIMWWYYFLIHF